MIISNSHFKNPRIRYVNNIVAICGSIKKIVTRILCCIQASFFMELNEISDDVNKDYLAAVSNKNHCPYNDFFVFNDFGKYFRSVRHILYAVRCGVKLSKIRTEPMTLCKSQKNVRSSTKDSELLVDSHESIAIHCNSGTISGSVRDYLAFFCLEYIPLNNNDRTIKFIWIIHVLMVADIPFRIRTIWMSFSLFGDSQQLKFVCSSFESNSEWLFELDFWTIRTNENRNHAAVYLISIEFEWKFVHVRKKYEVPNSTLRTRV